MQRRPGKTLTNDLVFDFVQALAFIAVILDGVHSAPLIIGSWGIGAVAGALLGFFQFSVRPSIRGGLLFVRDRWQLIKWLDSRGDSRYRYWSGHRRHGRRIARLRRFGGLNAAQTLVTGPAMVLIQATGSVGLPEASRALAQRGRTGLWRVSLIVMAAGIITTGASFAVILIWGKALLRLIYGPQFSHFWLAADVISLGLFINSFAIASILVLKATKRAQPLFYSQVVSLAALVIPLPVLAVFYGVTGAADAILLSCVGTVISLLVFQRSARWQNVAGDGSHVEKFSEELAIEQLDERVF